MNDREKTSMRSVAGHLPLREVVCAVDFSLASTAAARTALGLVQAARGRLTLLHVMEPNPRRMVLSGGEALRYLYEYEARAAMASERLMRLVPSGDRGLCRVEPLVVSGLIITARDYQSARQCGWVLARHLWSESKRSPPK